MIGKTEKNHIEAQPSSFIQELRQANPAGAALLDKNAAKAGIARSLREMRKARRLTQEDVSKASGLTQPMISRLESPLGPMPALESVVRYVRACDGGLILSFQIKETAGGEGDALQCSTARLV